MGRFITKYICPLYDFTKNSLMKTVREIGGIALAHWVQSFYEIHYNGRK